MPNKNECLIPLSDWSDHLPGGLVRDYGLFQGSVGAQGNGYLFICGHHCSQPIYERLEDAQAACDAFVLEQSRSLATLLSARSIEEKMICPLIDQEDTTSTRNAL